MQDRIEKQDWQVNKPFEDGEIVYDTKGNPIGTVTVPLDVTEVIYDDLRDCIRQHCEEVEDLANDIHKLNQKWWKRDTQGNPIRNKGEAIALMHSELSEALEGIRKDKQDDHLPEFKNEVVELADCIIRVLDYCAGFDLPIGQALIAKLEYNASRADHKLEERMKDGGKKF